MCKCDPSLDVIKYCHRDGCTPPRKAKLTFHTTEGATILLSEIFSVYIPIGSSTLAINFKNKTRYDAHYPTENDARKVYERLIKAWEAIF